MKTSPNPQPPEQDGMRTPSCARMARLAVAPDAQAPTEWIAQYLECHQAPAIEDNPPWDEVFVPQAGPAIHREVEDLSRRLLHLQQRVQTLEQRSTTGDKGWNTRASSAF
jgi:hypothetical protein